MPSCIHHATHTPWPIAGTLVICPGERTCGYCTGEDAQFDHQLAVNLRKHVYETHTDGGKKDYAAVEVMMYKPWQEKKYRKKTLDARGVLCFREDDEDGEDEELDETPPAFHYPADPHPPTWYPGSGLELEAQKLSRNGAAAKVPTGKSVPVRVVPAEAAVKRPVAQPIFDPEREQRRERVRRMLMASRLGVMR